MVMQGTLVADDHPGGSLALAERADLTQVRGEVGGGEQGFLGVLAREVRIAGGRPDGRFCSRLIGCPETSGLLYFRSTAKWLKEKRCARHSCHLSRDVLPTQRT
jgi:hypothetical protein